MMGYSNFSWELRCFNTNFVARFSFIAMGILFSVIPFNITESLFFIVILSSFISIVASVLLNDKEPFTVLYIDKYRDCDSHLYNTYSFSGIVVSFSNFTLYFLLSY